MFFITTNVTNPVGDRSQLEKKFDERTERRYESTENFRTTVMNTCY